MNAFIEASIEANRQLKIAIDSGFKREWSDKTTQGAGGDRSSKLDLFAEKIFTDALLSFGMIDSEESGLIGQGDARIILDPLDGTSNALSSFPYYASSIARINEEGILEEAIVCNLATGELFFKEAGKRRYSGFLDSNEWQESSEVNFSEIGIFEKAYEHPKESILLHQASFKFRSPGAIALSLAYAYRVDFVLFIGAFRLYDFAAGLALCEGLEVCVEEDYVIVSREKKRVQEIVALLSLER